MTPLCSTRYDSPLQSYVDGGGGLVVIGGPNSYGVGGYTGTALDDLLPVSMKLPQRKDTPTVAVALIIEDLETQSNVNISKSRGRGRDQAAHPIDRWPSAMRQRHRQPADNGWAVPLQYVLNKAGHQSRHRRDDPSIRELQALRFWRRSTRLRHAHAKIKHIILLGDGDAEDTYFPLV